MPRPFPLAASLLALVVLVAALALAAPGTPPERTACSGGGWSHLWTWRC